MRGVWLDHLFLRIGTVWTPPTGGFLIIRERLKSDACFAKPVVAVDLGPAPSARIGVVGAPCGGAVCDERFECREAAYYHSWNAM
jgi:hypothetical protein